MEPATAGVAVERYEIIASVLPNQFTGAEAKLKFGLLLVDAA